MIAGSLDASGLEGRLVVGCQGVVEEKPHGRHMANLLIPADLQRPALHARLLTMRSARGPMCQ